MARRSFCRDLLAVCRCDATTPWRSVQWPPMPAKHSCLSTRRQGGSHDVRAAFNAAFLRSHQASRFTAAPKNQPWTLDIAAPSVWHQASWWRRSPDLPCRYSYRHRPPPCNGRSRSPCPHLPPFARRRFPCARTALQDGFGTEGGKPGQPQLTPWAAGIFPGPHYTPAGNIPSMLAWGVSPGWPCPDPFLRCSAPPRRSSGAWGGAPCQRPIPLSPPTPPPFARRCFACARTALQDGFGTENQASRTLFTTPVKPGHRLFHIFSPRHFTDLRPWGPSNPQSVPYSGTGPRKRNLGGMTLVFPPLSATAISPGGWERCYVSQCRRLNQQAERSHRRSPRMPSYRQVTKIAR